VWNDLPRQERVGCPARGIGLGGAAVVTAQDDHSARSARAGKNLQIRLNPTAWPPNRADAHPLTMEVLYQLS